MLIVPTLRLDDRAESADPRRTALGWSEAGFSRANIDLAPSALDFGRTRWNIESLIGDLSSRIDLQISWPVERSEDLDMLSDAGACLVRVGPRGIDDPVWLAAMAAGVPDTLVLATTARERRIRSRGWIRSLPVDVIDLAQQCADIPLGGFQIDIPEPGPDHSDLALIDDLVDDAPWPIIVSVGAPTLGQLRDLERRGASAVIVDGSKMGEILDEVTLARMFDA